MNGVADVGSPGSVQSSEIERRPDALRLPIDRPTSESEIGRSGKKRGGLLAPFEIGPFACDAGDELDPERA